MTTISVQVAPRVGAAHPRGARAIAWLFLAGARVLQALFVRPSPVSAQSGPERTVRELLEVRELAFQYRVSDPGFSADLYAAADRHERLHGAN